MRDDNARGGKSAGAITGRRKRDDASPSSPDLVVRATAGDDGMMAAADTAVASQAMAAPAPAAADQAEVPQAKVLADTGGGSSGSVDAEAETQVEGDAADDGAGAGARSGPDGLIGQTLLDRYEITRKLGQGGMGAVYEATHKLIGKRVAIKVLLDKYAGREQIVARLEQEARLASSIGHEHIIDMTDFGKTEDGRTFVVMEFLDGQSLGQCLSAGPMPEERIVIVSHQVASALHAAHEKGIVHRDIKPENIFLLERQGGDFVKVVDFGISKSVRTPDDSQEHSPRLTQTGMVLGTPLYMSPEQAQGSDNLDRRIDVYSLGVIMYEMATGEVPFHGNNYLSIISQVLNDQPTPPREIRPDISRELEDVILRALEKEPDDRYQSCEELAADLGLLLETYGVTTSRRRVTVPRPRRRRRRKHRSGLKILAWIAGVAGIVCAVAVTVYVLMSGGKPTIIIQESPAAAPPAEVDAAPASATSPDASVEPALTTIKIITEPEGALILDGGRELGRAPFEHELPREDRRTWFEARLDGYENKNFWVNPSRDGTVTVPLERLERGNRARPPPRPQSGGQGGTGGHKGGPDDSGTAGGDLSGNPYERPNKDEK